MSPELVEEKRALRRAMRAARDALEAEQREAQTVAATERLVALPALNGIGKGVVAGYIAFGGELSPAGALAYVRDVGGTVALPRVSDSAPRMRFHRQESGVRLVKGRFGIKEPPETAPEIHPGALAVMIVPGLAFDAAGRRVGFGGGYYDGVIDEARAGGAVVIGFAYDFQVVDRCPAGPDDRSVDLIVTDARLIESTSSTSARG